MFKRTEKRTWKNHFSISLVGPLAARWKPGLFPDKPG
jgi:hypothetical protein